MSVSLEDVTYILSKVPADAAPTSGAPALGGGNLRQPGREPAVSETEQRAAAAGTAARARARARARVRRGGTTTGAGAPDRDAPRDVGAHAQRAAAAPAPAGRGRGRGARAVFKKKSAKKAAGAGKGAPPAPRDDVARARRAATNARRDAGARAPPAVPPRAASTKKLPSPRRAKELLYARLPSLRLEAVDNDGDGNCQFQSLAVVLNNGQDHALLRNRAVERMFTNRSYYEPFVASLIHPKDLENFGTDSAKAFRFYLEQMIDPAKKTYGDNATLDALANLFNVTIKVYSYDEAHDRTINKKATSMVKIGHIVEKHFVALLPLDD